MRLPTLYLKWDAFCALIESVDRDKDVGIHVFREDDGPERFSKLKKGDLGCAPDIAQALIAYMNGQITAYRNRKGALGGPVNAPPLSPADLELPTFAFVAKLVGQLPNANADRLDSVHKALVEDLTIRISSQAGSRLVIDRFVSDRSFESSEPSGGSGPIIFEAGKHRGQLAIIGETRVPLAAYTLFTRDPAATGKRLWDLSWGEAVLWFPAPAIPVIEDGRLLLMPKPQQVKPQAGRFVVTTALVWNSKALEAIEPRPETQRNVVPNEAETSLFLTRLRRIVNDKRKIWNGAVTVLSTEYIVKV